MQYLAVSITIYTYIAIYNLHVCTLQTIYVHNHISCKKLPLISNYLNLSECSISDNWDFTVNWNLISILFFFLPHFPFIIGYPISILLWRHKIIPEKHIHENFSYRYQFIDVSCVCLLQKPQRQSHPLHKVQALWLHVLCSKWKKKWCCLNQVFLLIVINSMRPILFLTYWDTLQHFQLKNLMSFPHIPKTLLDLSP